MATDSQTNFNNQLQINNQQDSNNQQTINNQNNNNNQQQGYGEARKNIEDVRVGDRVVSQDEKGNKSVSRVTKLDQPVRDF